jgi:hypothetical protein
LASRRPGAPHNRLKHEATLIEKHQASADSLGIFYMEPAFFPPFLDFVLVSLRGSSFRFLATPSLAKQYLPDASSAVANSKGTLDDFRNPRQRP